MQKIIILGATGGCVDILDAILDINRNPKSDHETLDVIGLLDDNKNLWGKRVLGSEVIGPFSLASDYPDCKFITGIGSAENYWQRENIIKSLAIPLDRFLTVIHPSASISSSASIGLGSVIFQNTTITTNARVGKHVLILPNCVISHDVVISDYSILNAGVCLAGNVNVGVSCYLGANSSVRQEVSIGSLSLLGMGSVVVKDIDAGIVVVGNPASFLRKIPST